MERLLCRTRSARGFNRLELVCWLVVIAGLLAVAGLGLARWKEGARQQSAVALFRDVRLGMNLYEADHQRPPVPESKRLKGLDTVYGDPGGYYANGFLVAVLAGEDRTFPFGDEVFATREVNPAGEVYVELPLAVGGRGGVAEDGNLYDPWGGGVMIAVNSFAATGKEDELVDFNEGCGDRRLHTWSLAEYQETRPDEQSFVIWSYGGDGCKGDGAEFAQDVVPLAGSDDLISW